MGTKPVVRTLFTSHVYAEALFSIDFKNLCCLVLKATNKQNQLHLQYSQNYDRFFFWNCKILFKFKFKGAFPAFLLLLKNLLSNLTFRIKMKNNLSKMAPDFFRNLNFYFYKGLFFKFINIWKRSSFIPLFPKVIRKYFSQILCPPKTFILKFAFDIEYPLALDYKHKPPNLLFLVYVRSRTFGLG